jgi:hypothetical protein
MNSEVQKGVRESQNEKVKEHLVSGKTITPLEALSLYGCFRLGARIWDLRRKYGLPIVTERVVNEKGNHYAKYSLPKGEPA